MAFRLKLMTDQFGNMPIPSIEYCEGSPRLRAARRISKGSFGVHFMVALVLLLDEMIC